MSGKSYYQVEEGIIDAQFKVKRSFCWSKEREYF